MRYLLLWPVLGMLLLVLSAAALKQEVRTNRHDDAEYAAALLADLNARPGRYVLAYALGWPLLVLKLVLPVKWHKTG